MWKLLLRGHNLYSQYLNVRNSKKITVFLPLMPRERRKYKRRATPSGGEGGKY
jgi:hypothetical protein